MDNIVIAAFEYNCLFLFSATSFGLLFLSQKGWGVGFSVARFWFLFRSFFRFLHLQYPVFQFFSFSVFGDRKSYFSVLVIRLPSSQPLYLASVNPCKFERCAT